MSWLKPRSDASKQENGASQSSIPFTRFEGYLRQADAASFSEITRRAMNFAFPGFLNLTEPTTEMQEEMAKLREIGVDFVGWRPRPYRRYAGSDNLPRGAYYSVASDESGFDHGTLLLELMAYRNPLRSGLAMLYDFSLPESFTELGIENGEPVNAIGILFIGRPGCPSPFLASITDAERAELEIDDQREGPVLFLVTMPYLIHHLTIDRAIDLRRAEVQDWFLRTFALSDFDGYRKPERKGLSRFTEMLPALLNPDIGGCELTHAIGVWLRRNGANALIFPSARANCMVENQHGRVTQFTGWNLIDYRNSPVPDPLTDTFIDVAPNWMHMARFQVRVPANPDFAGSWAVMGNHEFQRDRLTELEREYRDSAERKTLTQDR